jgi:hypothetical protein
VLGTVELLEQILSHVPVFQIMQVREVSKAWRRVIRSSTTLQHGCFLKPLIKPLNLSAVWFAAEKEDPAPAKAAVEFWKAERKQACSLVALDMDLWDVTPALALQGPSKENSYVLNPLAGLLLRLCDDDYRRQNHALSRKLGTTHHESKLMRTFLTQPPTQRVAILEIEDSQQQSYYYPPSDPGCITIEESSGITIRHLKKYMKRNQGTFRTIHGWYGWYPVYAGILESGNEEADKAEKERGCIQLF